MRGFSRSAYRRPSRLIRPLLAGEFGERVHSGRAAAPNVRSIAIPDPAATSFPSRLVIFSTFILPGALPTSAKPPYYVSFGFGAALARAQFSSVQTSRRAVCSRRYFCLDRFSELRGEGSAEPFWAEHSGASQFRNLERSLRVMRLLSVRSPPRSPRGAQK